MFKTATKVIPKSCPTFSLTVLIGLFLLITARRIYASAVLGVIILSVRPSHACFVTNLIKYY